MHIPSIMGAELRRAILFVLIIAASLFSAVAKPKPKIDGSVTKLDDKNCVSRSWYGKCILEPIHKPLRVLNSIRYFLRGPPKHKEDEKGRGLVPAHNEIIPLWRTGTENKPGTSTHTMKSADIMVTRAPSAPNVTTPVPDSELSIVMKNLHRFETEPCGVSLEVRIYGGEETMPGEFPWLAQLRYQERYSRNKELKSVCGGSLINERYVLTAAHCLTDYNFILKMVRFGEYYTDMDRLNCTEEEMVISDIFKTEACRAEPPRDYEIHNFVYHHEYTREKGLPHDIGLVRLKKKVQYTKFILPICLPVGELMSRWDDMTFGVTLMVTGRGMSEMSEGNSPIPLKANTTLMVTESCRHFLDMNLTSGQLCVGDDKGGSPCHGDSGGPLSRTIPTENFEDDNSIDSNIYGTKEKSVLVGVVSFGTKYCKIQPTVFTSVKVHLWWILKNVKP